MTPVVTTHYPISSDKLPSSWASTTVGEILSDIQPGFASGIHNQEGVGIPHLRPMNVDRDGKLDLSVVKYVSGSNPLRVNVGDVLFNNTNSAELIGKTAYVGIEGDLAFSNHMTRLRPAKGVDSRFTAYQMHFLWMTGYFQHRCTHHVNQASVASGTLAETVPFIVAPRNEQLRIVGEIEKQFTRLDAAIGALKRVQANLKRYRAAVLKAACEGRLVTPEAELARREGRSYESASVLVNRIRVGPDASAIEHQADGLKELPEGWTWTTLSRLLADGPQNGLYLPKGKYGRGTPILRIDDFQSHHSRPSNDLRLVEATAEQVTMYSLQSGDMVINRVNSPSHLGKTLFVEERNLPALFESNMMRIRLDGLISTQYVVIYLSSTEGRARLTSRAKWAVNQASINQQDVLLTPVPLPPADEQHRIVAEALRQLSILEEIQNQVGSDLKLTDRLRQSVLKQAFRGLLTQQDPNEESASILLERIRTERNVQPKKPARSFRGRRKRESLNA